MFKNILLLHIDMTVGFLLLAYYSLRGVNSDKINLKKWAAYFAISGFIAAFGGLNITCVKDIPAEFGIMAALFGIMLLGVSLSLALSRNLLPVAACGAFSGAIAFVMGIRFLILASTMRILLAGIGFTFSGLAGIFSPLIIYWHNNKIVLIVSTIFLIFIALIWIYIGIWHITSNILI